MKDILAEVKTKARSVSLLEKLDSAINASYSTKSSKKILEELPWDFSQEKEDLAKVLSNAKDKILGAKLLDVTVAIDLDEKFESKLYNWFSTNGIKDFLLDVHKDPSIYGGVVLSFNGKYVDLSLKRKVCDSVQHKGKL